jgi:hypothetical protein
MKTVARILCGLTKKDVSGLSNFEVSCIKKYLEKRNEEHIAGEK